MRTSILRYRNRRASILTLLTADQEAIRQLGDLAIVFAGQQDKALWAKASTKDFLPMITKGAMYLAKIGREKGPEILLQDAAAQQAFMTCLFLASQSRELCMQCRSDLRLTTEILAECCVVDMVVPNLPDPGSLHGGLRRQSIMVKHFPALQKAGGTYEVSLADALRLLNTMERAPSPGLVPIMTELRRTTEALRQAIQEIEANAE